MIRINGRYDISEAGKVNKGMWTSDQGWFVTIAASFTHTLVDIAGTQKIRILEMRLILSSHFA